MLAAAGRLSGRRQNIMLRGTWSLLIALILGLALPVVAQQPQSPPPVLIVPGQSLGGVLLGRSAAPPAAAPTVAAPQTQFDIGLVSLPRVENLRPFSPETQYMSVVGFLRYVVYQQTRLWLTHTEAGGG